MLLFAAAAALPEAARLIRACVPLLPGGATSCTTGNPEDECSLSRVAAGNTNKLYCLERERGDRFLVRAFGTGALDLDREAENAVFAQLSAADLAPPLVGTFAGGRIEGWWEGAPVPVAECRTPEVYEQVAAALARLHAFRPAGSDEADEEETWAWRTVGAWLPAAVARQSELCGVGGDGCGGGGGDDGGGGGGGGGGGEYAARVGAIDLEGVRDLLAQLYFILEAKRPPRRFCHDDLSNTNLHRHPATGEVRLLDFEYAGHNYRGFDLATHLSHWAGGAEDGRYEDAAFPRGAELSGFLTAYAEAVARGAGAGTEAAPTVEELLEEVRLATPLAHAVWGLWAVCSLPAAEEAPFSHIEYAERRLAAYEAACVL